MPRILGQIVLLTKVIFNALPILAMIALVPAVENDYALTGIYLLFIAFALLVSKEWKKDLLFLSFGFVTLCVSEYLFISTGVERFERTSLFGVMPLWLPFLWAYVFIAIRRMVSALDRYAPHFS